MTDEPLIRPVSPGSALVRLSQVYGALHRSPDLAATVPADAATRLQQRRDALLRALESGDYAAVAGALHEAQDTLHQLYRALADSPAQPESQAKATLYTALGFPDPQEPSLQPVDVRSVVATHSLAHHQVVTALAFAPAPGATAYWVHEIRAINDEPVQDALLESGAPVFTRIRLPIGPHLLRLESRNASTSVFSEAFTIEVPDLRSAEK